MCGRWPSSESKERFSNTTTRCSMCSTPLTGAQTSRGRTFSGPKVTGSILVEGLCSADATYSAKR
jgi:hypothetical protein